MQQAYQTIRVVAEAQTVRIVFSAAPDAFMLGEMAAACAAFGAESGSEVKAVILDTGTVAEEAASQLEQPAPAIIAQAEAAVCGIAPPTLAIARGALSAAATTLALAADLFIMTENASLRLPVAVAEKAGGGYEVVSAREAMQKRFVTWLAAARTIDGEAERVLELLRGKSALALRLAKASVNLAPQGGKQQDESAARLAALQQINELYQGRVAPSMDASEGLRAFLEKRKPQWKNR